MEESKDNGGASGGDIIEVTQVLQKLLTKQSAMNQDSNCSLITTLTNNILTTNTYLFSSIVGWNEIPENQQRYNTSSNILSVTELSGFSLANTSTSSNVIETPTNCRFYTFNSSTINMEASNVEKSNVNQSICHYFEMSSICIAKSAIEIIGGNTIIQVAVEYAINSTANIFPSNNNSKHSEITFGNRKIVEEGQMVPATDFGLNDHLIGLTLNNGINISTNQEEPVTVTFHHIDQHVKILCIR